MCCEKPVEYSEKGLKLNYLVQNTMEEIPPVLAVNGVESK